MPPTSQVRGNKAKNELWEHHREAIERLYLHQNKTLAQVAEEMANTYGFTMRLVRNGLLLA